MPERERIVSAIYEAVDELNKQLPRGIQLEKSVDAPLYGKGGKLESIDLVNFIMEVEDKMRDEFGVSLTIADERAMSQQKSPFLTMGTLADYVANLLKEDESDSS